MNKQVDVNEYLDRILALEPIVQRAFSDIHRQFPAYPLSGYFFQGLEEKKLANDLDALSPEDRDEIFRMLDEKLGLSKKEEENLIKDRHKIMLRFLSFSYLNHTERRQLLDSFGDLSEEDQNGFSLGLSNQYAWEFFPYSFRLKRYESKRRKI